MIILASVSDINIEIIINFHFLMETLEAFFRFLLIPSTHSMEKILAIKITPISVVVDGDGWVPCEAVQARPVSVFGQNIVNTLLITGFSVGFGDTFFDCVGVDIK